jgi:hypothetical protein
LVGWFRTRFGGSRRFTVTKLRDHARAFDHLLQGFGAGFGQCWWGDVVLFGDGSGVAELFGDVLGAAPGAAHERAECLSPDPGGDPVETCAVEGRSEAFVGVGLVEPSAARIGKERSAAGGILAA